MKILDLKQHSVEWHQARLGIVTASEADALVTPTFKVSDGKGVETYLYKKVCERFLGYAPESGGTFAMEQGNIIESIARPWYAFTYGVDVKAVGFCVSDDGRCGCSPDGMLPDGSGLEIKSPQGATALKYFINGEVPPEYRVQVAFSLYVTGAPYWTFVSYHRQLPPLVVRVEPEAKQVAVIQCALAQFFEKFDAIYAKIDAWREAAEAPQKAAYEAQKAEYAATGKIPD